MLDLFNMDVEILAVEKYKFSWITLENYNYLSYCVPKNYHDVRNRVPNYNFTCIIRFNLAVLISGNRNHLISYQSVS